MGTVNLVAVPNAMADGGTLEVLGTLMKELAMLKPHRWHTRVLAPALLAAACSTEQASPTTDTGNGVTEEAALADAASGARVQLSSLHGLRIRLYQSSCATSFVITEFVPVIGPDGNPVLGPDGRPIPARFTISITGPCKLRQFGAASLSAIQEVVFNPDGSQRLHGEFHYRVASGDMLYSVFDGTGAPPTDPTAVAFEGWERFTGGTGQFAQARGGAKAQGSANLVAGQSEYRTLGVIGY